MGFVEDSARLEELIELEGRPIGVWYADLPPSNVGETKPEVACQSIQDARFGSVIALNDGNSRCIGGSAWLGLIEPPSYVYAFLTEIEKSFVDRCAAAAFIESIPTPPTNIAKYLIMAPVEKCERPPSLILFVCRPAQAARLLGLHAFRRGAPARLYSYAAACSAAIGIPMRSNELNVSFIDNAARNIAYFAPEELIVSVPLRDLHNMAESIEHCIWGTAKVIFSAEEEKLKGDWRPRRG